MAADPAARQRALDARVTRLAIETGRLERKSKQVRERAERAIARARTIRRAAKRRDSD